MTMLLELVGVVLLILLNAFFVAGEYSLVTVRRTRMKELSDEGSRTARSVVKITSDPPHFIAAMQLGVTLTSLAIGALGERVLSDFFAQWLATILAVLLAVPLGTLSAIYKDTWIDHLVRVFSIAGLAVPSFWLGMIIILTLLTYFSWIPPLTFTPFFEDPLKNLSQLIWPALAVGYRYSAVAMRMMRSSVLEVLQEDYVRTARAKGVHERLVVARHAMRNALLPVVTVVGLEFAFLIGGLVVTEQVFNLNGIGKLFVQAVSRGDYNMIQGLVLLVAVFFVMVNFVIDMLYALLDPRIRYR